MISSAALPARMGSIDDPLHSLLIGPEEKKTGKGERQGGEKVGDTGRRAEDHSEGTEGMLGNKVDQEKRKKEETFFSLRSKI